jgi:hypothetical protein
MSPFYYKYIDPIIDYLQPLIKIITDPVVDCVILLFIVVLIGWFYEFINAEE